jgi:hypothetical protein
MRPVGIVDAPWLSGKRQERPEGEERDETEHRLNGKYMW